MAWDDVLAAVGGAAGGADNAIRYWDKRESDLQIQRARLESQLELQNLKSILALALQDKKGGTAVDVATIGADSRQAVAGTQGDTARDVATIGADSRERIAGDNRDAADARFWEGTMPLGWSRVDATIHGQDTASRDRRYGVDVGARTARRGQDIGADTSRSNADLAAAASQRNTNARVQQQQFGISARGAQFNALMNPGQADAAPTAPALPPPVTRAPTPVAPRGAPSSAPPRRGATAAPPSGAKSVTMQELQQVAQRRGTTVDAEVQRYKAGGYSIVQ